MDLHVGRALTPLEIETLLTEARARTALLVQGLSEDDLRLQHDPLMSPIVWDLGHIAHYEEVWLLEKLGGIDVQGEGLRGMYNPFDHPRSARGALPLPRAAEVWACLAAVRRAVLERVAEPVTDSGSGLLCEGFVFRMVLQHEYQHNETILQTLQLKKGAPYAPHALALPPSRSPEAPPDGSMVRFGGGEVVLGTDDRSTAYDNERPAHAERVDPFEIDVHPVTNEAYLAFVEEGGYDARHVWSERGWSWRQEAGLTAPLFWERSDGVWTDRRMDRREALDPLAPVCHICYWEAEAYAAWAGKRLPTEAEWETAASWDPSSGAKHLHPWGDEAPDPSRANLDAQVFGTTRIGSYPRGVSPLGCWDMLGNVWEWTSSPFRPYPGYRTFPYPEYSEVFFGDEYRVLRGGSWATRRGAIRNTFRNWDYPIRRQIFSGARCARDV